MDKNSAGEITGTIDRRYKVAKRLTPNGLSAGLGGSVVQHENGRDLKQQTEPGSELCDRRQLLDALPAAIYTTDAAGRITFFNQAAVEFSGRTPEIGSDQWCVTWRLYWPDGRPMAHDECPMARALKEDRPIRGGEAIAERPDGTRVPFMAYPTPLHDASGRLVGAVNMLVDLTAAKEVDEARSLLNETLEQRVEERTRQLTEALTRLRESERRFRLFVGGVTDYAIFMLDTRRRYHQLECRRGAYQGLSGGGDYWSAFFRLLQPQGSGRRIAEPRADNCRAGGKV